MALQYATQQNVIPTIATLNEYVNIRDEFPASHLKHQTSWLLLVAVAERSAAVLVCIDVTVVAACLILTWSQV